MPEGHALTAVHRWSDEFSVSVAVTGETAVVTVTGELDLYTAPRFRESMAPVLLSAPPEVVMDLSGVEFIDSSGIGVMVGALKRLRAHDGRLTLTGVSTTTRRALELVGLTRFMQIEPAALEEAGQR